MEMIGGERMKMIRLYHNDMFDVGQQNMQLYVILIYSNVLTRFFLMFQYKITWIHSIEKRTSQTKKKKMITEHI